MIKYILFFFFTISQYLFCQADSIKLIDELKIDLSIENYVYWENYNKKINAKSLIFYGKGIFEGKYYKNGEEIIFNGNLEHKKEEIKIDFKNSIQDNEVVIKSAINEILNISNYYYFKSNKKAVKPYEEFAVQKDNNTWVFNTYKGDIKKANRMEDKKIKREVILDNNGRIKRIITSLTHKNDIPLQNHFQDHHIEINVISYGIKQKFSRIKGEIISVNSKNKIEFSIVFP